MVLKEDLLIEFNNLLKEFNENDRNIIIDAYNFSYENHKNQKRASGEEYIIHPLSVAIILLKMNVDKDMIIAGLLHDIVEDTNVTLDQLEKRYGSEVSNLVDGVTKISKLKSANKREQNAETIRKMLVAMTKDVRVVIIKLADKLHNMSTLSYLPQEKIKRIANETLEIYAPLAGKLGMNFIKNSLENYSLLALKPEIYNLIDQYIKKIEKDIELTLEMITKKIKEKLGKKNIPFVIKSRIKHYYSIYKKMIKYNKKIDEIFDLYGLRIITDTIENCYLIFGIVHSLWHPVPGRFKDYIAHPKNNGYRSLHTTVIIQKRKVFEIQIRTEEMDEINEYGVAAHWYYKKNCIPSENDLYWLKRLKDVHKQYLSPLEYYETIRDDILKDEIYVFTPKGDIIELPKGSCALDFAYKIHTEIGHRCKGAKANGVIISLDTPLKNGSIVEIITGNKSNPRPSWLKFVKTNHARKKIKHELSRILQQKNQLEKVKKEKEEEKKKDIRKEFELRKINEKKEIKTNNKITIEVDGEKNLLFNFAKCCSPDPYDDIIGFISRGRGIIIHKKNCNTLLHIKDWEKRVIKVEWSK